MATGQVICNFSMRVQDASGVYYINESYAKTLVQNATKPNVSGYTQLIPTTAGGTALDVGSVATNGVCWLQNCDPTNFIEIGVQVSATFYPLLMLKAGEAFPVRMAQGIAPYARANTASVVLKQPIVDD